MLLQARKLLSTLSTPLLARAFYTTGATAALEHYPILKFVEPSHLIDVGSNKGQFAILAQHLIPSIVIDCFEAIPHLATKLGDLSRIPGFNIRVHPVALSDRTGESVFNVTSREDSSSLFPPAAGNAGCGITIKERILLRLARLDEELTANDIKRPSMLKIDVQGAELLVLKGSEKLLDSIDFIYTEVSFISLYDDQPLFREIDDYLLSKGFSLIGVANSHADATLGPTQADVLYVNIRHNWHRHP